MTTSAEPDPTLGNDDEIANQICIGHHMHWWHSIVSNLFPTGGPSYNVQRFGLGMPQRGDVAHKNRNGPCILEWLWDDGHLTSGSSGHGLAWQPHCALYLAPKCKAGMGLYSHREQSPLRHSSQALVDRAEFQPPQANPSQMMGSRGPKQGISGNLIVTSCGRHWSH